jgi:hypothetical protein
MSPSLGAKSIILFGLSTLFLVLITLFESSLSGLSTTTERVLSLVLLVLPGIIGVVFGVLGVLRKEAKIWIAYLGVLLNGLFALFQLFVISFAG